MFLSAYIIYKMAFLPKKGGDEYNIFYTERTLPYKDFQEGLVKDMLAEPYEDVWTFSHDGLKLHAYGYFQDPSAPVSICFHGYNGMARRDFCGGYRILKELGHNILLVDQRSQGLSEGRCMTFGIKERYDCLSWVEYARKRFGEETPMYLMGISLGGATVLMASDLDYKGNVKGILADCPFSGGYDIISRVATKSKGFPSWVCPLVKVAAKLYGKFDLTETTAAKAAAASKIPMMIIHGQADDFVPPYMSEEIAMANPKNVERHTFPGADHGVSYILDPLRYKALTTAFMERHR